MVLKKGHLLIWYLFQSGVYVRTGLVKKTWNSPLSTFRITFLSNIWALGIWPDRFFTLHLWGNKNPPLQKGKKNNMSLFKMGPLYNPTFPFVWPFIGAPCPSISKRSFLFVPHLVLGRIKFPPRILPLAVVHWVEVEEWWVLLRLPNHREKSPEQWIFRAPFCCLEYTGDEVLPSYIGIIS